MTTKLIILLAKYLGIVELNGHYCIPTMWYVDDIEKEEDNIIEYEAVRGLQIFPTIKRVDNFKLTHGSLYRSYIKRKIKKGEK